MLVETVLQSKGGKVHTIAPDASIADAAKILNAHRIGALVAVDGEGPVVGILSERDIVRGMAQKGDGVHKMAVRDLMSTEVITCTPQASLEELMQIMTRRRVRHLPVVDNGKLCGIVTIGDVVKNLLTEAKMEVDSLRDYVMAGR